MLASKQCPRILNDQRFWQLVIFIVKHSSEGSVGLILNRPSGIGFSDILQSGLFPDDTRLAAQNFRNEPIYLGGLENHHEMSAIHGYAAVPACTECGETGVFYSGVKDVLAGAMEAGHDPSTIRFFFGTLRWGPGVLEQQMDSGAWIAAAASRAVVLKQCARLPVPLWREVLLLMGGEYVDIAGSIDDTTPADANDSSVEE